LLNSGKYRTDVPRFFNWKGIDSYDKRYNLHKIVRCSYDGKPNIRSYKTSGKEGLLVGPPSSRKMALGTVIVPAMHLAAILGSAEIFLIGVDLVFKGDYDHFYNDKVYRDGTGQECVKPANKVHVVDVLFKGTKHKTTDYFKESAGCIDNMIVNQFKDIRVYDFSDGLINNAIKANVDDVFNKVGY